MISCDFAPNEQLDDALLSLKLLFQPWRFKKGKELNLLKKKIFENFLPVEGKNKEIFFFLTGRAALYYLLKSLNLKKSDEILVQAFTCEAVILPIIALKLKPIYVDIEKTSFSINPIDLERKITPKSKVVILQHTFGITPTKREKILNLVKQHNLLLIEDIAHGTMLNSSEIKSSNSTFLLSFGRSKALSSVFGGAIISQDQKIIKKLKKIKLEYPSYSFIFKSLLYKPIVMIIKLTYSLFIGKLLHKIVNILGLLIPEITSREKQAVYEANFNKGYPNALAILLLYQLEKFSRIKKNREEIFAFYQRYLRSIPKEIFKRNPTSLIRYPVLLKNRDFIIRQMAQKNIFLGQWYNQVVAPRGFSLKKVGYKISSCPTAEKLSQEIINLPTNIKKDEAKKVLKNLNFFKV